MSRIFIIQKLIDTGHGKYWTCYDDDISSLVDGNVCLQWLAKDQPEAEFQLIELFSWTENGKVIAE